MEPSLEERMDASGGEFYVVKIIARDGLGQTRDDWHATVTRGSDKKQLVFISDYKWLLKWKTRLKALERAYQYADKHDRKMAQEDIYLR